MKIVFKVLWQRTSLAKLKKPAGKYSLALRLKNFRGQYCILLWASNKNQWSSHSLCLYDKLVHSFYWTKILQYFLQDKSVSLATLHHICPKLCIWYVVCSSASILSDSLLYHNNSKQNCTWMETHTQHTDVTHTLKPTAVLCICLIKSFIFISLE